jgi:hypothetical protein
MDLMLGFLYQWRNTHGRGSEVAREYCGIAGISIIINKAILLCRLTSDFQDVTVIRVLAFPWLNSLQVDLFFGDFWLLTIEGRASRAEPVAIVLY